MAELRDVAITQREAARLVQLLIVFSREEERAAVECREDGCLKAAQGCDERAAEYRALAEKVMGVW